MSRRLHAPTPLSSAELETNRAASEQAFIGARETEGPARYLDAYVTQRDLVETALRETDDLLALSADPLLAIPELWQTLRYCCAPPVSEEDLWTVVGKKFRRVPASHADAAAAALRARLDPVRFPWVSAARVPTAEERERATLATAVLLTTTRIGTARRGSASAEQEARVAQLLVDAGYALDTSKAEIRFPDELPRHHFSSERKLAGSKCDVPVRLPDGRLLAIECKVSNGPKSGWKRLHREIGGKAQDWRSSLGEQVVTCAVVGGSFDLSCLRKAQDAFGVFLVFDHDLARLDSFLREVT